MGERFGQEDSGSDFIVGVCLRFAFTKPGEPVLLRAVTACFIYCANLILDDKNG